MFGSLLTLASGNTASESIAAPDGSESVLPLERERKSRAAPTAVMKISSPATAIPLRLRREKNVRDGAGRAKRNGRSSPMVARRARKSSLMSEARA